KTSAKTFANSFNFGGTSPDRVGVISFTNAAKEELPLSANITSINNAIDGIQPGHGGTYIGPAITLAHNSLKTEGIAGHEQLIVLISDGRPTHRDQPKTPADLAKVDGIRLIMIGVGNANQNLLTDLASPNPN